MDIIVVCGAGVMGGGIAQVCANAGYDVWMWDLTTEIAQNGKNKIAAGLDRQVARGKLTEEQKQALLDRLHPTDDLACAKGAAFVLEAVPENIEIKKNLFARLREFDEIKNVTKIYAPMPDGTGVGLAVLNRLIRAAGFSVLELEKE